MARTVRSEVNRAVGSLTFFHQRLRHSGSSGSSSYGHGRCGSTEASTPRRLPTKNGRTAGSSRTISSAMASAGIRCPPVPPPVKRTVVTFQRSEARSRTPSYASASAQSSRTAARTAPAGLADGEPDRAAPGVPSCYQILDPHPQQILAGRQLSRDDVESLDLRNLRSGAAARRRGRGQAPPPVLRRTRGQTSHAAPGRSRRTPISSSYTKLRDGEACADRGPGGLCRAALARRRPDRSDGPGSGRSRV